jgi:hypothetical protein
MRDQFIKHLEATGVDKTHATKLAAEFDDNKGIVKMVNNMPASRAQVVALITGVGIPLTQATVLLREENLPKFKELVNGTWGQPQEKAHGAEGTI